MTFRKNPTIETSTLLLTFVILNSISCFIIMNNTDTIFSNTTSNKMDLEGNPYFYTPHFITMNAKVGDNVTLKCFVTNNQKSRVAISWWRQDWISEISVGLIVNDPDKYSIIRSNDSDWSLQIKNVTQSDSGQYICQINLQSVLEKLITLEVKRKIDSLELKIKGLLVSGTNIIFYNHPLILTCEMTMVSYIPLYANWKPLNWYHNNTIMSSQILSDIDIKFKFLLSSNTYYSVLVVSKVQFHHQGEWACFINSMILRKSASIFVSITDRNQNINELRFQFESESTSKASRRLWFSNPIYYEIFFLHFSIIVLLYNMF